MATAYHHALHSAKKFGGKWQDYIDIHQWFDVSKQFWADPRHRVLRHHMEGVFQAETVFGVTLLNSDEKEVPVKLIGEQHLLDDFGFLPTLADWCKHIAMAPWMTKGARSLSREFGEKNEQK